MQQVNPNLNRQAPEDILKQRQNVLDSASVVHRKHQVQVVVQLSGPLDKFDTGPVPSVVLLLQLNKLLRRQ